MARREAGHPEAEPAQARPQDPARPSTGEVIGNGVKWTSSWALRVAVVLISLWLVMKALSPLWIAILPVLLGLVLATVLWPPTRWLRDRGLPPAGAAALSMLLGLGIVAGAGTAIGSSVASQAPELATQATAGVGKVQEWIQGPPFNVRTEDIDAGVKAITDKIRESGGQIAGGVLGGVTSTLHVLVTGVLALLLTFFFIKDGPRFLPWMRRVTGDGAGNHLTEVMARMWRTLGGYIRAQALVSLVDAVFIGLGLFLLGVPLWLPLAVLTFFGGFIPIVGATVAGALAVLVALVTTTPLKALIVLGIVIAVQQLEGHVLQPLLQSRSMNVHPALIILGIAVGSEMRGIIGAFLAVPTVALLLVLLRYFQEQIDLRSGARTPDDLTQLTDSGHRAAASSQAKGLAARRVPASSR